MKPVIAILGAESTGKTTLAGELVRALCEQGHDAVLVTEYLREFCDAHGRPPRQHEQDEIAREQTRRIAQARAAHGIVVADTTALMIAVYSDFVFGDIHLYPLAEAEQARYTVTLLSALDLPWTPDGLQRDGPQVREPVTQRVRASLDRAGVDYAVIGGQGPDRLASALRAVQLGLRPPGDRQAPRWHWFCEHCGDGDCERHLLPRER